MMTEVQETYDYHTRQGLGDHLDLQGLEILQMFLQMNSAKLFQVHAYKFAETGLENAVVFECRDSNKVELALDTFGDEATCSDGERIAVHWFGLDCEKSLMQEEQTYHANLAQHRYHPHLPPILLQTFLQTLLHSMVDLMLESVHTERRLEHCEAV